LVTPTLFFSPPGPAFPSLYSRTRPSTFTKMASSTSFLASFLNLGCKHVKQFSGSGRLTGGVVVPSNTKEPRLVVEMGLRKFGAPSMKTKHKGRTCHSKQTQITELYLEEKAHSAPAGIPIHNNNFPDKFGPCQDRLQFIFGTDFDHRRGLLLLLHLILRWQKSPHHSGGCVLLLLCRNWQAHEVFSCQTSRRACCRYSQLFSCNKAWRGGTQEESCCMRRSQHQDEESGFHCHV